MHSLATFASTWTASLVAMASATLDGTLMTGAPDVFNDETNKSKDAQI